MANKRLQAKSSRKRKPSGGGGSSFDYASILVGVFIFLLLAPISWYFWPRPGPSIADKDSQHKLKKLTTQNPDAEVFDLGVGEKKN